MHHTKETLNLKRHRLVVVVVDQAVFSSAAWPNCFLPETLLRRK